MDVNTLSSSLNSLQVNPSAEAYSDLTAEEREQTLQAELEQVRQVNDVMDGVLESISTAETNLETVLVTARNADKVLDTWVKILSQTEHTKDLLFDPAWQGATQDDELQAERELALQRKREQERAERERQERQEALKQRKLKEIEERKKMKQDALNRRVYGRRATGSSLSTMAKGRVPPGASAEASSSSSSKSASKSTLASSSSSSSSSTSRTRPVAGSTGRSVSGGSRIPSSTIPSSASRRPAGNSGRSVSGSSLHNSSALGGNTSRTNTSRSVSSSASSSRIQPPTTGIKRNAASMRRM